MPTALAVSPHLDDAVFSAGGTLARLAARGWRVVLCTVFTASVPDPQGFALACQLDKGLAPEVDYMALRREEDRDACAILGAEPLWLPFREAPHRGYGSAPALFGATRADDERIVPELADALRAVLDEAGADLVLAPQAIGGHVDHVQVVRALHRLDPAASLLWWRDFPYTVREASPPEPFVAAMASRPDRDVALEVNALARKRAACLAYRSQVPFQFGDAAGLDAKLTAGGSVERFRGSGDAPHGLALDV